MRLALAMLTTVSLVGCSDGPTPATAPTRPVPTAPGPSIWTMVADDSGLCITGATVQVVAGQGAGRSYTQTEPCNVWDFGGIAVTDLIAGIELTLRASAPGYVAQETVVVPTLGGSQRVLIITLSPSP